MPDQPSTDVPDALFKEFPPATREEWEAKIRDDLREGAYERTLVWDSLEGVSLRAYYRADDLVSLPHTDAVPLAEVGEAPANTWRIRQDLMAIDRGTARRHAREALDGGVTDLGLHLEIEEGAPRGVPVQRQEALAAVLADVDLAETPIHLTGGPAALPLLAMLCNVADERGVALSNLRGSIDYDPIAALVRHRLPDADRAFDLAATVHQFAPAHTPEMRAFTVDLRPYHATGASIVQELGLALGALSEQLVQLRQRNGAARRAASRLHLIVPLGTSFFMTVAKLRALRLLVPQVLAAFEVDASPADVFIQATTSRREETIYDPYVNLLRATTEATVGVIGGCDVLAVRPYTAAFEAPDDFALRLARNTQLILQHEAHLDHVADPAAGSYYIETLTDKLARAAWDTFQALEEEGGLLASLRTGSIQARIADVRRERQAQVATRSRVLVGTNHYPNLKETRREDVESRTATVSLALSDQPLALDALPAIEALREAAAEGATLGDVLHALEGSGSPTIDPLPPIRLAEPFETLRLRTERYAAEHDGPPLVFLMPIGDRVMRSARANFARNVFGVAGFAIDENLRFETPEEGAQAAADASADIVVICSSDAEYPDVAPAVCQHLQAAGADPLVVVAGNAPDHRTAFEDAGVDGFIHRQSPLLETLEDVQQRLGIG